MPKILKKSEQKISKNSETDFLCLNFLGSWICDGLIKEEREKLMKLYKELVRIINDPEDRRIKT